jgi:hypothetical protein
MPSRIVTGFLVQGVPGRLGLDPEGTPEPQKVGQEVFLASTTRTGTFNLRHLMHRRMVGGLMRSAR